MPGHIFTFRIGTESYRFTCRIGVGPGNIFLSVELGCSGHVILFIPAG